MTSLSTEGANKFSAFGWAGGWCYTIHVLPPLTTEKVRESLIISDYLRLFLINTDNLRSSPIISSIISDHLRSFLIIFDHF